MLGLAVLRKRTAESWNSSRRLREVQRILIGNYTTIHISLMPLPHAQPSMEACCPPHLTLNTTNIVSEYGELVSEYDENSF